MERALPDDRRELAPALALHHPVPRAPRRPATDRLHHQQHREPQPPDPQSDQDPRTLPRRTSRHEAHLPRNPPRPDRLEDPLPLDNRPQGPEDPLRRPTPRLTPPTSPDLTHRRSDSLALRRLRFTAAEIAELLDRPLSTVSGILQRIGMGRLGRLGMEPAGDCPTFCV